MMHAFLINVLNKKSRALWLGFSVVELMVVVLVLVIISVIAYPQFGPFIANQHADGIQSSLTAALRLARSEAIKRNTPVGVCPASTAASPQCDATTFNWSNGWIVYVPVPIEYIRRYPPVAVGSVVSCLNNYTFGVTGQLLYQQANCKNAPFIGNQPSICTTTACQYGALVTKPKGCSRGYQINIEVNGRISTTPNIPCP